MVEIRRDGGVVELPNPQKPDTKREFTFDAVYDCKSVIPSPGFSFIADLYYFHGTS